MATVHLLHPPPEPIGQFIRLGHTGHRTLETLHAAGRLPLERVVVDAAHLETQEELLDALRGSGVELVLDTRAAELATPGGYNGRARALPWAHPERPHVPSDFNRAYLREFATRIAISAVGNQVDAVLAPTHLLDRPIVADGIGGLVGLVTVAFGVLSGFSHGVASKERFDASGWLKPPSGGGGHRRRLYLPEIDEYLGIEQARILFAGRGAKALLACNDTSCCPLGLQDMERNPAAHFLIQSARRVDALGRVPEHNRVDYFLRSQLGPAVRAARKAERLNLTDTTLAEKLRERSRRLDEMHQILEDLYATSKDASRAGGLRQRARGTSTTERRGQGQP